MGRYKGGRRVLAMANAADDDPAANAPLIREGRETDAAITKPAARTAQPEGAAAKPGASHARRARRSTFIQFFGGGGSE